VSVEDDELSGWPSIGKTTENVKKNSRTHPWRLLLNNPWACRHRWDLNRKFEHVPHCREVCPPTVDKWSNVVTYKYVSWAVREG
jgi:hypothetical protein